MRVKIPGWEIVVICSALLFPFISLCAQEADQPFIHRLGIEARPQYVFPTNPFLQGENERWKPIRSSFAAHLKYSFKYRPNTWPTVSMAELIKVSAWPSPPLAIKSSWAIR